MSVQTADAAKPGRGGRALIDFKKNWQYLLLCLPSMIGYVFFHFVPLAGIIMPFTKYTYRDGIFGSKWVWFKNFTTLFRSPVFGRLIRNTVLYSVSFTIIGHAMAIFTALMLYELAGKRLKKLYQTSMMIPNFMSWVIVGYVTYAILHPSYGFIRQMRDAMNLPYYDFYIDPTWWPLILTLTSMWKGMNGYLIYAVAGIFGGDFGLFYTIPRNVGLLYETTDIINTYVFRGLQSGSFLQSSAIGLMQSVIGCLLLVGTNAIVRKVSPENSLF